MRRANNVSVICEVLWKYSKNNKNRVKACKRIRSSNKLTSTLFTWSLHSCLLSIADKTDTTSKKDATISNVFQLGGNLCFCCVRSLCLKFTTQAQFIYSGKNYRKRRLVKRIGIIVENYFPNMHGSNATENLRVDPKSIRFFTVFTRILSMWIDDNEKLKKLFKRHCSN